MSILVIGDLIIDEHLWCETGRISSEAPVPICLQKSSEIILGGAGNVAKQIGIVDDGCMMTTITNQLDYEIRHLLLDYKIKQLCLNPTDCFKIPKKTRVWSNGQQVCRIDDEDVASPSINHAWWTDAITKIISTNKSIKSVVFVDYDKGALTDWMINDIATFCKQQGILTIFDPKRPTFHNIAVVDIIKPNNKELESTGLTAFDISEKMPNTYLVVTKGSKGMVAYKNKKVVGRIPGNKVEVSDVCGAGDIACAALALLMKDKELTDNNIHNACKYANFASSRVVQHKGNYTLSKEEFNNIKGMVK